MWGSVKCEPVIIMKNIDALMIRAILRTTWTLDRSSGLRLFRVCQSKFRSNRDPDPDLNTNYVVNLVHAQV